MKYNNMLNSYILPYLGEELTNNLGYDEISDFCTALLQEGGADKAGLSPKITSDCLTLVKSIIKYASRKRCRVDTSAYDVSIKLKSTQWFLMKSVNDRTSIRLAITLIYGGIKASILFPADILVKKWMLNITVILSIYTITELK